MMKSKLVTILCGAGVLLPVVFLVGADPGPRPAIQWEYGIYVESVGYYDWQEAQRRVEATDRTHFFEKMGFPRGIEVNANTGRLTALALNHLGNQGWELVDVRATGTGRDVYLLKRPR
jgi:hypothetical protein